MIKSATEVFNRAVIADFRVFIPKGAQNDESSVNIAKENKAIKVEGKVIKLRVYKEIQRKSSEVTVDCILY